MGVFAGVMDFSWRLPDVLHNPVINQKLPSTSNFKNLGFHVVALLP
jgi:hypothetical protein